MIKVATSRMRHSNPDVSKCALIAAVLSAILVAAIELTGTSATRSNSDLGGTLQTTAEGSSAVTAPVSAPR
jgi:amino acid permease